MRCRNGIIFALLSFFAYAGVAFGAYPKPVGFVNDFAGILSAPVRQNLEQTLREYEQKTSIELAVVTISSLEGNTVEDYTIGLARAWGVGKKKEDNGVVLLVAPNERKVRIEVGYSVEPDLTDGRAGTIIQNDIIPYFQKNRMADGVIAGVSGIIRTLGDTPFAERLALREAKKEQERIAHEQTMRAMKTFGMIAGMFAAGVALIGFVWYAVMRAIRNRRELQELHAKNILLLKTCGEALRNARARYPNISAEFGLLKKENPKEVWRDFSRKFEDMPASFESEEEDIRSLEKAHEERGWRFARDMYGKITEFSSCLDGYVALFDSVHARLTEVAKARDEAPKLLASFPATLERAKKSVSQADVTEDTKLFVARAAVAYQDAKPKTESSSVNWLAVAAIMAEAFAFLQEAEDRTVSDRAAAERARKEGPALLAKFPDEVKKAEKAISDSDVSGKTKNMVKSAKEKYQTVVSRASGASVDWVFLYALLATADSLLKNAIRAAQSDIENAEDARRSSYSSSSSWSSGSSSSSGGGSFGGFGGGGFGGGGASGSW